MKIFICMTGLFAVLFFLGMLSKKQKANFMDRRFTTSLKGFSILTVVWAHSGARLDVDGIQFIAGVGVAIFLICSGYGLEKSYERNGIAHFWKKRILRLCIPYWLVQLVGTCAMGTFALDHFISAALFIQTGWFMQYILICYIIFWVSKKIVVKFEIDDCVELKILIVVFAVWFFVESFFFADPDMPFIAARQMLSFPLGILLAKKQKKFEILITNKPIKNLIMFEGGITILALAVVMLTQFQAVKELPYVVSNILALGTVFPLAIVFIILVTLWRKITSNWFLLNVGLVSYEIYLVHAFTDNLITDTFLSVVISLIVTGACSVVLKKILEIEFIGAQNYN